MEEITLEQIQELQEFLTGRKLPEGMEVPKMPKLDDKVAFMVIWFLQEHLHVLPEHYEMCQNCHTIYDSHREGYYLDDQYELRGKTLPKKYWGPYCEGCAPNIDFELP